ncbi:MAG TPA: nucleoside 2-deoxyribosyltransferase [Acidimicrobiales bacterium]
MYETQKLPVDTKTVYLAGPEVFLPEDQAKALGARKKVICRRHGFEPVFPLDLEPDVAHAQPHEVAMQIFRICTAMMERCDLVIANMTPFRGVSMDVGTAIEIGFMLASGKPVFAYTNVGDDYIDRVSRASRSGGSRAVLEVEGPFLAEGDLALSVEDFGLCDNLMCEGPVRLSGGEVVRYSAQAENRLTELAAFEECVQQARQVLGQKT